MSNIEEFVLTIRNLTSLLVNVKLHKDDTYLMLLNDSPLNLTISGEEVDRVLKELTLGNAQPMGKLINMIYQIYKARTEHTKNDWDAFYDVIFNVTNDNYSQYELEKIFIVHLPERLRDSSYNWGMTDTPWREDLLEWAQNYLIIEN